MTCIAVESLNHEKPEQTPSFNDSPLPSLKELLCQLSQTVTYIAENHYTSQDLGEKLKRMQQTVKQLEGQMEHLDQSLAHHDKVASIGLIAAGLVHELSSPLTCIVAYSELLLQNNHCSDIDQKRLQLVHDSAMLIRDQTRYILSYARCDTSIAQAVFPAEATHQAIRFCKHLIDNSNVHTTVIIAPDTPCVHVVFNQLVQILTSLIINACQAMAPQGGSLIVRVKPCDHEPSVVFAVTDSGSGIAPELHNRIFEPFFTTKAPDTGTGLGLTIVKQIVSNHRGNITVTSTPGNGATFEVTLPISKSSQHID